MKNRTRFLRHTWLACCMVILLGIWSVGCTSTPSTSENPPSATETTAEKEEGNETIEATPLPDNTSAPSVTSGGAADIAVDAAKPYAGTTLRINYEAGLQALDGHFFGSEWERLTGIKVEVVEHGFEELYRETLEGAEELDIINLTPAWEGDFVSAGILEPLDDYMTQYYPAAELEGLHPTYRDNWLTDDTTYGFPDDGDIHILYYRRDLFEDPAHQEAFQEDYGYELAPPTTWQEWDEICAFFTEQYAPELYGCALQHTGHAYYWFQSIFRSQGGTFFDPETMDAQINSPSGVKAAEIILSSLSHEPPGAKDWDFSDNFGAWLEGRIAMTISWPPIGRWSEGYGSQAAQLDWLPETQVAGKVGYATQPGGGELAIGYKLGVSAHSQNKEAAYLFIQWLTSEQISLQRTMTPFTLRDPYRLSHYESILYKSQWAAAPEYLDTLYKGAETGYLDLMIPGTHDYEEAEQRALSALLNGADIQSTLDDLAAEWDTITERYGIEAQKEAYLKWLALPNAYGEPVEAQ